MEGDTRAEVVVLARGSGSGETRRFMRGSGALSPAEAARSTDIVGEGVESGEGTGEGGEAERKKVFVWTDVEADRDETGGGRQRAGEAE